VTYLGIFPAMANSIANGECDKYDLSSINIMMICGTSVKESLIEVLLKKCNLKFFVNRKKFND